MAHPCPICGESGAACHTAAPLRYAPIGTTGALPTAPAPDAPCPHCGAPERDHRATASGGVACPPDAKALDSPPQTKHLAGPGATKAGPQ